MSAAARVAAGSGGALEGGLCMVAFATTSGLGLLGAGLLVSRLPPGAGPSRVLAVGLALGAVVLFLRPLSTVCH